MSDSFEAFRRFLTFFSELFAQPGLLSDVQCRQSYKEYVPEYYRNIFNSAASIDTQRHLKWYRRLAPVMALPHGATIVDYGGGYGMDTIFLASLGYELHFYELTPHHIAIARWFADRFGKKFGKLPIHFCLAGTDARPSGMNAVLANEVTHHIEPAKRAFEDTASMLESGGHLFLLEPNYLSPLTQAFFIRVRGFQTTEWRVDEATGARYLWGNEHIRPFWSWNRLAREAGLSLNSMHYFAPWFFGPKTQDSLSSAHGVETWPIARLLLASHITYHYKKL